MSTELRDDLAFLRNLVLRARGDRQAQARDLLGWALIWLVVFLLGAGFPGSWAGGAAACVLVLGRALGPSMGSALARALGRPVSGPEAAPTLVRAFNAGLGAAGLLAFALVALLQAWHAAPVADGGIWLLIVGSAYLAGSFLLPGPYAWLGGWLLLVGLVVPLGLPGPRAASLAYAVLGGGSFLLAAGVLRGRRS